MRGKCAARQCAGCAVWPAAQRDADAERAGGADRAGPDSACAVCGVFCRDGAYAASESESGVIRHGAA